jgi:hypothetical protein
MDALIACIAAWMRALRARLGLADHFHAWVIIDEFPYSHRVEQCARCGKVRSVEEIW